MAETGKFLEGSTFRHVTVMSLTSSLGLIAIFAVDFVDMIFISMLGQAELAAAVGYAGALLFFTTSFGIGLSISAGALSARALGAGDPQEASKRASNAMGIGVFLGAAFALLVWMFLRPLTELLGATGDTLDLAVRYLAIVVPSLPLLVVGMIGSAVLRAHGAAKGAMMVTIWAGLVNAILDPILIFGFNLGLDGAAFASVASRMTIAISAMLLIRREQGELFLPSLPGMIRDLPLVFSIAFPAILTQLATPVGQGFITRIMAEYGEAAVAGMAIVARLTPISFAVIFALSGAVGPIIGQNYGAGKHDRVRATIRDALIFTALYVIFISLILFLLSDYIVALFEADGISASLVILFCGPLALAYFFNGVIFVTNASFNNLGHPFYSTSINWGRHTLGTLPFAILGGWWLGASGVLIGPAIGGAIFAGLAMYISWRVVDKVGDQPESTIEKPPFQGHRRMIQMLLHRR